MPIDEELIVLDRIDPGAFSENENLFESVMGRMYQQFETAYQEKCRNNNNTNEVDKEARVLARCFEQCTKAMQASHSSSKELMQELATTSERGLDKMDVLATGVRLQELFSNLLNQWMKFVHEEPHEHGQSRWSKSLVIPIDDIDLYTGDVMRLLEDLRVPLAQDRVILVCALRVEQLQSVVEEHYRSKFQEIIKAETRNFDTLNPAGLLFDQRDLIAQQFVDKQFPPARRIFSFDLNATTAQNTEMLLILDNPEEPEKPYHYRYISIYKAIYCLHYQYTDIAIFPWLYPINPILPNNLRNLHQLLKFLTSLISLYGNAWQESKKDTDKQLEHDPRYVMNTPYKDLPYQRFPKEIKFNNWKTSAQDNLNRLEQFMENIYIKENLSRRFIDAFKQCQQANNEDMHLRTIRVLLNLAHELKQEQSIINTQEPKNNPFPIPGSTRMNESETFRFVKANHKNMAKKYDVNWENMLMNIKNNPSNVSLGDTLATMRILTLNLDENQEFQQLIYALKMMLSIRLTRAYARSFDNNPDNDNPNKKKRSRRL